MAAQREGPEVGFSAGRAPACAVGPVGTAGLLVPDLIGGTPGGCSGGADVLLGRACWRGPRASGRARPTLPAEMGGGILTLCVVAITSPPGTRGTFKRITVRNRSEQKSCSFCFCWPTLVLYGVDFTDISIKFYLLPQGMGDCGGSRPTPAAQWPWCSR